MARLANAEVMGFFATPPTVIDLLVPWLTAPTAKPWRLLDPCCGAGAAAAQLAAALGGSVQTWGAELSPQRAAQAAQVLDKVQATAWQATRITQKSVSLLWLNPPYDSDLDGNHKRLEIEFLRLSLNTLVYGGVLVYIVPQHLLGYRDVARMLAGHFAPLSIHRFPDGAYERFKQIVILGQRQPYVAPTSAAVEDLRALRDTPLPPLAGPVAPWPLALPAAPERARFYRADRGPREQVALACEAPWAAALLDTLIPPADRQALTPPITLKQGQISLLMASGLTGVLTLRDAEGQPLLVKGRVRKVQDTHVTYDDHDNPITVTKDRFITTLGVISPTAGVQVISDETGLRAFMEEHGLALAETLLEQPPRYDLQPTPEEWRHLGTLSKNRTPLPGQSEAGLLPTQKHVAIAVTRTLRARGSALLQGEMGTGKTSMALAVLDALDAYPALLIGPPQLMEKWPREAAEVIPGIHCRVLTSVGDVQQFQADWEAGRLGTKALAVISETRAKLGAGWQGAPARRYTFRQRAAGVARREAFRQAYTAYEAARRAALPTPPPGCTLAPATPPAPWPPLRGTEPPEPSPLAQLRQAALKQATAVPTCPVCGQQQLDAEGGSPPFKAFDRTLHRCDRSVPTWQPDETAAEEGWRLERTPCDVPLYEFGSRFDRWPIADYIRRQARGCFRLLIADEVHQFRGKGSDRGKAFHHLVTATQYQLGLTGTLYGGKSTSVFYLLYRLFPQVRAHFPYVGGAKLWAQQYGVLETRQYGKAEEEGEDVAVSKLSGTRRARVQVSELPGISPAILGEIIEQSLFISMADLGQELPPYAEEAVSLTLTPAQAEQYAKMDEQLRSLAREDPRWLSTWLQWALARPNSGFRSELIEKVFRNADGEVSGVQRLQRLPAVHHPEAEAAATSAAPATGEIAVVLTVPEEAAVPRPDGSHPLPKESWLTDFCGAEAQAGRKTLVFCRQTGARDIQPRLQAVLEAQGLRTQILYGKRVSTAKREAWIRKHSPQLDVLICNPTLVETGLDLIQFANVVFYELDYDLYKLWQAMRRVWRLGQTQPVKVIFTSYSATLEEQAVRLMGKKMRAAQLLYGDDVGGAIVPEDDGNFLAELARAVLEEHTLPDLRSLFAEVDRVTLSPLGSPTAVSPRLHVLTAARMRELWEAERAQAQAAARERTQRRRTEREAALRKVGAAQPGLF